MDPRQAPVERLCLVAADFRGRALRGPCPAACWRCAGAASGEEPGGIVPSLPFQRAALVSGRHRHRQAAHPARQLGTV